MKKIILSMMLCIMAITASAQLRSLDIKADLRGDFGVGAGLTIGLDKHIDLAPAFNYYFVDGATVYSVDADFHFTINIGSSFTVYPILGAVYYHAGSSNFDSDSKIGLNIGAGGKYDLNSHVAVFVEGKYQWVNKADDSYLSFGFNLSL